MASTTRVELEDLIAKVGATPDWEVKDLGVRWRITWTQGGGPLFIPKRPPTGNTLTGILRQLQAHGWSPANAEEAQENGRRTRIKADAARNDARMAELEELIAAQEREAEQARNDLVADRARRLEKMTVSARTLTGGIKKDVIVIDLDFAKSLLEFNNFFHRPTDETPVGNTNRPFDRKRAEFYARQMLTPDPNGPTGNAWYLTHQGIAIDEDGAMSDGQHRLAALVIAGTTGVGQKGRADRIEPNPDVKIMTEITYDLPRGTFAVIDQGKARTVHDVLANQNIPNRMHVAATLRLLRAYDQKMLDKFNQVRLSTHDILHLANEVYPTVQDAIRRAGVVREVMPLSAAAAGIILAERAYPGAPMDEFLLGLGTGYNLPPGDPRKALDRWATRLRRNTKRFRALGPEQLAYFLKTWNLWLQGQTRTELKMHPSEAFPHPIKAGNLKQEEAPA